MLCVSYIPNREIVQENLLFKASFFTSIILYIPLFFTSLIIFVKDVKEFIYTKNSIAFLKMIFFPLFTLFALYVFNKWFFEKIM